MIRGLRDRGTIKWTSIFLPEHVEMLREFMREYEQVAKPILDEYEIAEIEAKIQYAYKARLPLKFRYWRDGFEGEVTGRIRKIDALTKEMRLEGAVKLRFDEIIGVNETGDSE
jgi:YolD-like protein